MVGYGSFVVIFNEDRTRFLMHQRRDFRIWSLPGGHIEAGERPEDAAVREAMEETGYKIRIKRFLGEYWRPQIGPEGDINYLFIGEIIGGKAIQSGKETVGVAWFDPMKLPLRRRPTVKMFVQDAVNDVDTNAPFKKTVQTPLWQVTMRRTAVSLGVLRD